MKKTLTSFLTSKQFPWLLAGLAMLLCIGSLTFGWYTDDVYLRLLHTGGRFSGMVIDSYMDAFHFFDPQRNNVKQMIDYGLLPWWSLTIDEITKGGFWRPVTCLTHWLDYHLWPDSAAIMHLHNLIWYGGLAVVVSIFYRKMLGITITASIAALFYITTNGHGFYISALCGRNGIIAVFFGVACLITHHRYAERKRPHTLLLSLLLLALSLLSAEIGISTCAYLGAYELFYAQDSFKKRLLRLLPYVAVVIIWRLIWSSLGYGIDANITGYIDPLSRPGAYLAQLWQGWPFMMLGLWTVIPAEIKFFGYFPSLWPICAVFSCVLIVMLWPIFKHSRQARFFLAGMLFSILPACTVFPQDRTLIFAGIGAMGLLGQFLTTVFYATRPVYSHRLIRPVLIVISCVFILMHGILSPIALAHTASPAGFKKTIDLLRYDQLDFGPEIANQDLIVVNPPVTLMTLFSPLYMDIEGKPVPAHQRILCSSLFHDVIISRPSEKILRVEPTFGFTTHIIDKLFYAEHNKPKEGDRFTLPGMTIEIVAMKPWGEPGTADFIFEEPLESNRYRWLKWQKGEFMEFSLPAIGETVTVSAEYNVYQLLGLRSKEKE